MGRQNILICDPLVRFNHGRHDPKENFVVNSTLRFLTSDSTGLRDRGIPPLRQAAVVVRYHKHFDLKQHSLYFGVLLCFAISCSNPNTPVAEHYCFVNFDSVMRNIDTSKVEFVSFSEHDSVEVRDKSVKSGKGEIAGHGSVFHFDSSGKLGLYAYMRNWPYTGFLIIYDSTGKKKRLQENEVVEWIFWATKDSTVKFTFLLCAVDRNYGDIKIESGKFKQENISLFESAFTKLICATLTINKSDLDKSNKIYISGRWQDKCSKTEQTFIDSIVAL